MRAQYCTMGMKRRVCSEEEKEAKRQRMRYLREVRRSPESTAIAPDVERGEEMPAHEVQIVHPIDSSHPVESKAEYQRRRRRVNSRSIGIYVDVGDMVHACRSCNALHFIGERKKGSSARNPTSQGVARAVVSLRVIFRVSMVPQHC